MCLLGDEAAIAYDREQTFRRQPLLLFSLMPTLSSFYGIKITMNYNDHNPPHIHAEYQDCEAVIMIQTGEVCGQMPKRGLNLIWEWLDLHQSELLENWENARQRKPLNRIDPLP